VLVPIAAESELARDSPQLITFLVCNQQSHYTLDL